MGRRKKEPQNVHRKTISKAAQKLFYEKGIENTSMSDRISPHSIPCFKKSINKSFISSPIRNVSFSSGKK